MSILIALIELYFLLIFAAIVFRVLGDILGSIPSFKRVAPEEDEECEHWELDHGVCMDCGEDQTEWIMAAAYDRAKDFRKYGH